MSDHNDDGRKEFAEFKALLNRVAAATENLADRVGRIANAMERSAASEIEMSTRPPVVGRIT